MMRHVVPQGAVLAAVGMKTSLTSSKDAVAGQRMQTILAAVLLTLTHHSVGVSLPAETGNVEEFVEQRDRSICRSPDRLAQPLIVLDVRREQATVGIEHKDVAGFRRACRL